MYETLTTATRISATMTAVDDTRTPHDPLTSAQFGEGSSM
jgi:hypothetical protein